MHETAPNPSIPASADVFWMTGRDRAFGDWLHAVRGDLPRARCAEVAEWAAQALDVLGAAAPHVVPADPAAAEAFLDEMDLTLLGVASHRRGKLKCGMRGLHAWANGFGGDATRRFMDRPGPADGILPPPAVSAPAGPPAGPARSPEWPVQYVPIPEPAAARATEVPASFAVLETAVAVEVARRDALGQRVGIRTAGRAVLHRHREDVRRQIAVRAAEACAIPPTAFQRDGTISTESCENFLLRLLIARGVGLAALSGDNYDDRSSVK